MTKKRTMRKISLALVISILSGVVVATVVHAKAPYTIAYKTFAPLNTAIFIANSDGSTGDECIDGLDRLPRLF